MVRTASCWLLLSTQVKGKGPAKSRLQRHGALTGRGTVIPYDAAEGKEATLGWMAR